LKLVLVQRRFFFRELFFASNLCPLPASPQYDDKAVGFREG
jgi:hypothetical protein